MLLRRSAAGDPEASAPLFAAVDDETERLRRVRPAPRARNPRQASVVEVRFFGGLSVEETAEVGGASVCPVKRDCQAART